jgi:hypothetical protein
VRDVVPADEKVEAVETLRKFLAKSPPNHLEALFDRR